MYQVIDMPPGEYRVVAHRVRAHYPERKWHDIPEVTINSEGETVSQDLMVPVLPLAATWEEFVRSLPRGRRRDMRRARNRAQKRGG